MLASTLAALGYPLRRQILISVSRTLTTQDVNGILQVDSAAAPRTVSLMDGDGIGAGGYFYITAPFGTANPVTVTFPVGNTYNQGKVGSITLSNDDDSLLIVAGPGKTWNVFFGDASGANAGITSNYVYRPGEPNPGGNVFADWAALVTQLGNVPGPKVVEVDDSIVAVPLIPTGTWDLNFSDLVGLSGGQQTTLRGSVGSRLQNLAGLGFNLQLQNNDPAQALYILGVNEVIDLHDGASLGSLVAAPVFERSGAAGAALVRLHNASLSQLGASNPAISIVGGAGFSLVVQVLEGSTIGTDTLDNDVGAIFTMRLDDFGSTVNRTQPGVAGTIAYDNIEAASNAVPQNDNVFDSGIQSRRWRSTVARVATALALLGAGTNSVSFGANSVGVVAGVANAINAAGIATVQISNPAAPEESGIAAHAIAQADIAGSVATASAAGPGASVRGYVRAETAHTGLLSATGRGAHASGYVSANGYNATILASGTGAHAFGYSQSYSVAGYGPTTLQATERGSIAMGAVQYDGEISSTNWGSMARGAAAGGAFVQDSPGRILASGYGSFASGAAAGSTIEADGGGAHAMGRARRTLAGGGPIGQIRALGSGCFAGGNALSGLIEAGTVLGFNEGAFAFGHVNQHVLGGTQPAIRASQLGCVAMGFCLGPNALIQAYNIGSFAFGAAECSVVGGSARIESAADNVGNLVGGQALASGAFNAVVLTSNEGSFAWGQAVAATADASLSATGDGAWAGGEAQDATILASGGGSMAHGTVSGGRSITASAAGSFAHGRASSAIGGTNILASGLGSMAIGDADTGSIEATAANSVQFGPGTNALADSVKIGGGGIQFFGIAAAPGAPGNGMFWVAGGNVYVRTGGISKNMTNII
jgi:hypothetical protein